MLQDPIEGAFFSSESDDETARNLVRESIQNSLDAKIEGKQARVRFTFGELKSPYAFRLYAGLNKHLSAEGSGLRNPTGPENGIKFLVIEDFETSGLSGDTHQMADVDDPEENRFYYFWRNVGRTGKGEGTMGTWGLGKTVFPASSRINTFFGLTQRENDSFSYLMGMSVLKSHQLEGEQYDPYGYFADWINDEPLSITDPDKIGEFCDNFHVSRQESQTGLSIVIPHVLDEFNVSMLRDEAIEHYFWPILNEELVIEIQENYLTPPETIINRDYLLNKINDPLFLSSYKELANTIELAIWASSGSRYPMGTVTQPVSGSASNWENARWNEEEVEILRDRVIENKPFVVKVQVRINPINATPTFSSCMVYGMQVSDKTKRKSYLTRQGVNVVDACPPNPDGYVFILVPDEGPLSNMLAMAENPSHTMFLRTEAIAQRYARGTMQTIRFLCNAPRGIAEKLDIEGEQPDQGLFADVFWKVPTTKRPPIKITDTNDGDKTGDPDIPVTKRTPAFNIIRTSGGFRISDSEKRDWNIEHLDIRAAYDSTSGDPLKNHANWDFNFIRPGAAGLSMEHEGCEVLIPEPNRIRLTEIQTGFSIRVQGFDPKRDLIVSARSKRAQ